VSGQEITYDAILIPGGGLQIDGTLPPWVVARLEAALAVGHQGLFITLSAGTLHKPPPLNAQGFPIFESVAAAEYLMAQGIPSTRILTESCSYDTIGNAYFAYMVHILPRQLKRLLVITSEFHLARTQAIFAWVHRLVFTAHDTRQLDFQAAPNTGMAVDALAARQRKEAHSLIALQTTMTRITTLETFHLWLTTEHDIYALGRTPQRATGAWLDTY
jgi:hypothetical protein